jgi:hypothetical protein
MPKLQIKYLQIISQQFMKLIIIFLVKFIKNKQNMIFYLKKTNI